LGACGGGFDYEIVIIDTGLKVKGKKVKGERPKGWELKNKNGRNWNAL
jgi:hypothetical protein